MRSVREACLMMFGTMAASGLIRASAKWTRMGLMTSARTMSSGMGNAKQRSGGDGGGGGGWKRDRLAFVVGTGMAVGVFVEQTRKRRLTVLAKDRVPSNVPVTSLNREKTPDLPPHVQYLLIGGGTASFSAFKAIKAADAKAKVIIVGDEERRPYMRPPLTKEMWFTDEVEKEEAEDGDVRFRQWNGRVRSLFFEPKGFFTPLKDLSKRDNGGVSFVGGRKVVKIDVERKEAHLDNGRVIGYDKCLLATGARPRRIGVLDGNPRSKAVTTTLKTAEDFSRIYDRFGHMKRIAVVGGGFVGSEIACGMVHRGRDKGIEVVQMFPEEGNMAKVRQA